MNTLYTIGFYLALPLILARAWWRGRHSPGYRQRIPERLGYYKSIMAPNPIWLHAVSYGEAVAADPLIAQLMERYPQHPMLVTTMTATGAARIAQRFGDKVEHQYIPYDFPGATERFYQHNKPCIAIIMETELWPNLLKTFAHHQIPILLANARLSERSCRGYRRIRKLSSQMMSEITVIAAQSEGDASRFQALGARPEQLSITGNLKFDMTPRPDLWQAGALWRQQVGERPVWIAASTHAGEEDMVLAAHQAILKHYPTALLIIAPRHPERFDRVVQLGESQHFTVERFTESEYPSAETQVYIADTMGQLPKFYRSADIAFVGGSLVSIGGHNIIEAASANTAIITGPHMHNFTAIVEKFKEAKACEIVDDQSMLVEKILTLLENPLQRKALSSAAESLVEINTGVLQKLMQHIEQLLKVSSHQ